MTYEPNLEDTRPQTPVAVPAMKPGEVYGGVEDAPVGRPGCGFSVLLFALLGLVALLIVGLAAAAGWTTGQREASAFATATQSAAISEQVNRIPSDLASGNLVLLNARLQYLATLTPGVPEVSAFSATATAFYLNTLPTETPTPTPTVEATAVSTPEAEPTTELQRVGGSFDLPGLLQQAQTYVDTAQWEDAIELLDAISGIDSTFETVRVRQLLSQSLNSYARDLYNTYRTGQPGQLAQAIVITDRAEQLGTLADGLSYERRAAQLYLDARRAIGLDPFAAIRSLEALYNLGQGRYFQEAQQEIYNQYVALGDAQTALSEHCPAAQYYQSALNYIAGGSAIAKRDNANTLCSQATPVPLPGTLVNPGNLTPIAPIGVPGT